MKIDEQFERDVEKAKKAMGRPRGRRGKAWDVNAKLAKHLITKCGFSHRQVADYMKISTYTLKRALELHEKGELDGSE